MSNKNFLMGISGNLIAAGLGWYVKGPYTGLIIAGCGAVLWLVVFVFAKKPEPNSSPPPLKDSGNATATATGGAGGNASIGDIHIHVPAHSSAAAAPALAHSDIESIRETARREAVIIEYLKKTPNTGYDVKELSEVANISMPEVRDIMEGLEVRKVVWSVPGLDAFGGKSYFIDPLHAPKPQPSESRNPNTVTVYRKSDDAVIEFLKAADPLAGRKSRNPTRFHEAAEIARELSLNFRDTCDSLNRLEAKGRVRHIKADEPRDGALWALDDRED